MCATMLAAFGPSAHADNLASPPLFGGSAANGGLFVCRIFNMGPGAVTITQRRILRDVGSVAPLTTDNCTTPLAVNKSCRFAAAISSNFSYICKVVTAEPATNLRGVAESQGPTPEATIFNTAPMR